MPHILTTAEFAESLGIDPVTSAVVTALESAEALFEAETNNGFGPAETGRTEVYDGTGGRVLWLDRPVAALTSVKLGYNPSTPDYTLDVADQTTLNWSVGSNRLTRIGGQFGCLGQPNYVQVVYNSQAYVPDAVRAAILAGGELLYSLSQGGGDIVAERIGPYSVEYSSTSESRAQVDALPAWSGAVSAYRRVVVA